MNHAPGASETAEKGDGPALVQRVSYWLGCAAVYVAIVALYAPSVHYEPLPLDDRSQLHEVASLPLRELFGWDHFGHFRPLKSLLFWLVARSHDLVVWRATFVLLLVFSAVLVQLFATRVASSRWVGLGVVGWWALHPSTASAVCWLSAVNGVYALCAMLAYLLLSERSTAPTLSPGRRRAYRVAATVVLATGLLAHELPLLSPLLLYLLQGLWPRTRDRRLYTSSIAVVVAYAVAAVVASGGASSAYRFASETPRWQMSFSAARYAADNTLLWLWPWGRFGVLLGDHPEHHLVASAVWWVALSCAAYALWRQRERDLVVTFGLLWSGVSLALVCNVIPLGNTPVAVHYTFVPGVGLALALGRVLFLLGSRFSVGSRLRARVFSAVFIALVAAYASETSFVVAAWADEEALYTATLEHYPDNVEVLVNLSSYYLTVGRDADSARLIERARELAPDDLNVVRNQYAALVRAGDMEGALASLRAHPRLMEQSEFSIREGEALQQLDRFVEARSAFQRAFDRTDPSDAPTEWCAAGYGLSIAQLQTGATPREVSALVERLSVHCRDPQLTQLRELLR